MKYRQVPTNRFKKDVRRLAKRGYDFSKLEKVVDKLSNGDVLDGGYHDHNLSGQFAGFRECHIDPDWILVYKKEESVLVLLLIRTGTHADIF